MSQTVCLVVFLMHNGCLCVVPAHRNEIRMYTLAHRIRDLRGRGVESIIDVEPDDGTII